MNRIFESSSAVERSPVKRVVGGSSPPSQANSGCTAFTGHIAAEVMFVFAIIMGAAIAVETNKIGLWIADWMQ